MINLNSMAVAWVLWNSMAWGVIHRAVPGVAEKVGSVGDMGEGSTASHMGGSRDNQTGARVAVTSRQVWDPNETDKYAGRSYHRRRPVASVTRGPGPAGVQQPRRVTHEAPA